MTEATPIDLDALLEVAKKALAMGGDDPWYGVKTFTFDGHTDEEGAFLAAISPATAISLIEALEAERARVGELNERLENNRVYGLDGERKDVEPGSIPDGIECRNETIKLLDEQVTRLRGERDRLREALDDIALNRPISECKTFRPDPSDAGQVVFFRDFAREALSTPPVLDVGGEDQGSAGGRVPCRSKGDTPDASASLEDRVQELLLAWRDEAEDLESWIKGQERGSYAVDEAQHRLERLLICIDELKAAASAPIQQAAPLSREGWQDIATAPKDGTIVLLWSDLDEWPVPAKWERYDPDSGFEEEGYWDHAEPLVANVIGEVPAPTHWMPLPAPPAKPLEGDA